MGKQTTGMPIGVSKGERRLVNWLQNATGLPRGPLIMSLVRADILKKGGNISEIMKDEALDK